MNNIYFKFHHLFSTILISCLFLTSANSLDVSKAFAFAIYDENGKSENIQNINTTKYDYEGICYTKIVVFGKMLHNKKIDVLIGNSIGTLVDKKPITDIRKIVIAYEYTFKHLTVTNGLLQVKIDNKLYDSRVFVK